MIDLSYYFENYVKSLLSINKNLTKKNNPNISVRIVITWRKVRDSNPRQLSLRRFSRPLLSTAQPTFHDILFADLSRQDIVYIKKTKKSSIFFIFHINIYLFTYCHKTNKLTIFCEYIKIVLWRCIKAVALSRTRNAVVEQSARGFESLHLRHKKSKGLIQKY